MNSPVCLPPRRNQRTLLALASLVLVAVGARAETTDNIQRTLTVNSGGTLLVDVDVGRIEVRGSSDAAVVIDVLRTVRAGSSAEEERILREHVVTIAQQDDTVTIRARGASPSSSGSWWRRWFGRNHVRKDYTFRVSVPERFHTDLRTSGGRVTVARLSGDVRARTSGGGLEFTHLTGTIEGRTSGGSITLESCAGTTSVRTSGGGIKSANGEGVLQLATSGGSITVGGHRGDVDADTSGGGISLENLDGNIAAHTSGGSIRATLARAPTGECRLGTSGGSVTVAVAADAALELDAATSGGSVRSELPVTVSGVVKGNRLAGTINGGGPLLHLRTSGGSIRLTRIVTASGTPAVER